MESGGGVFVFYIAIESRMVSPAKTSIAKRSMIFDFIKFIFHKIIDLIL